MSLSNLQAVNIQDYQAANTRSQREIVENLVALTAANQAKQRGLTTTEYLNGHTHKEIADAVAKYNAQNEKDVILIMDLVVGHALGIIQKYNQDGRSISFTQMLERRKAHPEETIVDLAVNILRQSDPRLATNNSPHAKVNYFGERPPIAFVSVQDLLAKKDALQAAEIYKETNLADAEVLKIRIKNNKETAEENERRQEHRLANLEIAQRLDPLLSADFVYEKINAQRKTHRLARV
ncbi:hypothetical protein NO2_0297 [Candidatus Termititenax persephonae]|uniref:Uncharacterized protein n=1 Tax=Candidatus Termititenax persephonae TaxID=2218525 RepID=A0A388TFK4_9BACT|nr:hypothetical protein NO2_0297 [Candidatus Termititenax persephonae]